MASSIVVFLLLCFQSVSLADVVVRVGAQALRDDGWAALVGHRVAILTNPTGVFPDTLSHVVDSLNSPAVRAQGNDWPLRHRTAP